MENRAGEKVQYWKESSEQKINSTPSTLSEGEFGKK